jgi:plastocyanin domain-containing protein
MTLEQVLVLALGLAAITWIVWYFWLHRPAGATATLLDGVQQIDVAVAGGYAPNVVVVKRGVPVRLRFTRRESSLCSEMVVFDGIDRSAHLPEGKPVAIEFTPTTVGEIPFHCQMSMLRGKVVVTA